MPLFMYASGSHGPCLIQLVSRIVTQCCLSRWKLSGRPAITDNHPPQHITITNLAQQARTTQSTPQQLLSFNNTHFSHHPGHDGLAHALWHALLRTRLLFRPSTAHRSRRAQTTWLLPVSCLLSQCYP